MYLILTFFLPLHASLFTDYRLVIICSSEEDRNHHLAQNLHAYLRSTPDVEDVYYIEQYLKKKYFNPKHSQLGAPTPLSNSQGWKADIQK